MIERKAQFHHCVLLLVNLWQLRNVGVDGFQPTLRPHDTRSCREPLLDLPQRFPKTPLFSAVDIESMSKETAENNEEDTRIDVPLVSNKAKKSAHSSESYGDLPWSDSQEWALRDNVAKYTIQVTLKGQQVKRMIRWRTLLSSTPELAGYPISFVIAQYQADETTAPKVSTEVLPYLDKFRFESNGGLSGQVYGVRGIQDGTRIRTDPVSNVEHSIPLGYVATDDGSVVYELGQPDESSSSRMDEPEHEISSRTSPDAGRLSRIFEADLAQLGGLTAVVLSGAWAMQTLSHHLTVNIFWV